MAIASGPRPRAQRWSRAIYDVYPRIHGFHYPASMHANQPAVALYERASVALPAGPAFHRPLVDPALLGLLNRTARALGYRLV